MHFDDFNQAHFRLYSKLNRNELNSFIKTVNKKSRTTNEKIIDYTKPTRH